MGLWCSRKTLVYLILTLNNMYPDYDFSQLRAHHFRKEADVATAEEVIDSHLLETSRVRLFMFLCSLESSCRPCSTYGQKSDIPSPLLMLTFDHNSDHNSVWQVWEKTPGCGDAGFLDSVWTAIDEVLFWS
jgi:hypothetical protein